MSDSPLFPKLSDHTQEIFGAGDACKDSERTVRPTANCTDVALPFTLHCPAQPPIELADTDV